MDAFIVLAYLVWTTDPVTGAAVTRTEVGTCAKLLRTIARRVAICGDGGRLKSTLLCSAEGVACLGIPVISHIKARAAQGYRPLLSSSVLPRSKKLLRFTVENYRLRPPVTSLARDIATWAIRECLMVDWVWFMPMLLDVR
ncbi:hypothetical protein PI124_g19765 [Phytophthora idaei]|nr:hypothetical protein PI125_g20939 [Phytophthora idaei]KAG3235192.1 hypothetical protein PI124_g19765 [Phytophthora idaei]